MELVFAAVLVEQVRSSSQHVFDHGLVLAFRGVHECDQINVLGRPILSRFDIFRKTAVEPLEPLHETQGTQFSAVAEQAIQDDTPGSTGGEPLNQFAGADRIGGTSNARHPLALKRR
jgi:hypothetical protein